MRQPVRPLHRGANGCARHLSLGLGFAINKSLDESLKAFAERPLEEPFPYLILDARYEKVREGGIVLSQAVLIAIGIDWDGRRQILAVEIANRESRSAWKDFLLALRQRGLHGVELVVADDHAGLRATIREVITEAAFQRCYVHFLRNALDHLLRKADDDCLQERAGSTTGTPSKRRAAISQPGSPIGALATRSSWPGSKRPSRRRSPSTVCPASIISISRAQTCWSASTKRRDLHGGQDRPDVDLSVQ